MFGRRKRHITRLLLVEDEPLVAFDNEHLLSDAGFEIVATVDKVATAVAALRDGADLVVTDLSLADGSGLDVARAAQSAGVPVLFVSGLRPEADGLGEGWLAKPYGDRELLAAIAAIETRLGGKVPKRLPTGFELFERESAT